MDGASAARPVVAEFLGTALLLVAIVGSGITVSDGADAATALFQHATIVGIALAALILTFGPISGAHFNPVVTLVDAAFGGLAKARAAAYIAAQLAGAAVGVIVTNALFGVEVVAIATTDRTGGRLIASEALVTAGLLILIFAMVRADRVTAVPAAVGAYIAAMIHATPSAAFANPAVTVARTLTDTYTGMAPDGVLGFVLAQLAGGAVAAVLIGWLFEPTPRDAAGVIVPHREAGASPVPGTPRGTPSERISS